MTRFRRPAPIAAVPLLLLLALGAADAHKPKRGPAPPGAWGKVITLADRDRLRVWRSAWVDGLAQARQEGEGAAIAGEGALLDPDASVEAPAIPDGDYRCRTIKLGRTIGLGRAYRQMPVVPCRVRDSHFRMLAGSQRLVGRLWEYDGTRLIFLGATALGDESASIPYGRDRERDAVGLLDRIAPGRWRLALPQPAWEAEADVIEITPAG